MPDSVRHDPLPAYLRIAEMLTRDIAAGRLADGSRLAPERELARSFSVSVGTLRKALTELEARGLLTRRHGSGNYVQLEPRAAAGYAMLRIELLSGGGQPSSRLLSVDRCAKPESLAVLGPVPHAFRIRRLRLLSDTPVAVEEIWLDGRFGDHMDGVDLSGSLYRAYQQAFALWILRAEDRIAMGPVPDWAPAEYGLQHGAATLRIDRTGWDQNDQPAEMSITHLDTTRARYVARIP